MVGNRSIGNCIFSLVSAFASFSLSALDYFCLRFAGRLELALRGFAEPRDLVFLLSVDLPTNRALPDVDLLDVDFLAADLLPVDLLNPDLVPGDLRYAGLFPGGWPDAVLLNSDRLPGRFLFADLSTIGSVSTDVISGGLSKGVRRWENFSSAIALTVDLPLERIPVPVFEVNFAGPPLAGARFDASDPGSFELFFAMSRGVPEVFTGLSPISANFLDADFFIFVLGRVFAKPSAARLISFNS